MNKQGRWMSFLFSCLMVSFLHLQSPCGSSEFPMEVYNDLMCPICLEFFKHPVILPCSHVLCRSPCAEHLFDFNFIRCPVCRENCYVSGGIGSLPRVIALESIIEKYRSERRKAIQSATKGQQTIKSHRAPLPSGVGGESSESGACVCASPENSLEQRSRSRRPRSVPPRYLGDASVLCSPRNELSSPAPWSSLQEFSRDAQTNRHSILALSSTPRSYDNLDTSLFDVSAESVTSCPRHGSGSSLYCHVCERCVCDVCGDAEHVTTHETNTLDDAALQVKVCIVVWSGVWGWDGWGCVGAGACVGVCM